MLGILAASFGADAEGTTFADSFLSDAPGPGWRWIRENQNGGEWRQSAGDGLEIKSTRTSIYRRPNTSPNLIVRPVDIDNTVDIRVTATVHATYPGEQGGLMFYFDDDNYAKIVIEEMSDPDQPLALIFFTEENGVAGANRNGDHAKQPAHPDRRRMNDNEIRFYPDVPSNTEVSFELRLRVTKAPERSHKISAFWRRPGDSRWQPMADPVGSMEPGHAPERELTLPRKRGQWYAGMLTMFAGNQSHWQKYRDFLLLTKHDATTTPRVPRRGLIFDTDMDTDVDDIGAIAMIHALADAGEVKILATIVSSKLPESALCLNAINTFYGRPEIPVGAPKGEGASVRRGTRYADHIAKEYPHALTAQTIPDAVDVYRSVLAAAPDGSVVIATVGYLTNLRDLLKSGPDQHSPLSGSELVAKKVKELSCVGGRYPADRGDAESGNFRPDPDSIIYVARHWPTPIMFSGDELGEKIMTGKRVRSELPKDHPVRRAYDLFLGSDSERPSWDQAAVLYAVRGPGDYWSVHHEGFNEILDNGNNVWRETPDLKNHSYFFEKMDPDKVADVIEDLMVRAGQR